MSLALDVSGKTTRVNGTMRIKKGEVITSELLTFTRPGVGIPPYRIDDVIGKTALVDITEDTLMDFDMLED